MTKPDSPTKPEPFQPVAVRRHRIDWEAGDLDLAEVTAQRAMSLGPKLQRGCWYLNPRYTVSSPTPSAAFFRTVRDRRSAWLDTCRQILGTYGQRQEARRVERVGRLASLPEADQPGESLSPTHPQSSSSNVSGLIACQRREVIQAGRTAKNLAFGGLLFLDGDLVPPRTWEKMADEWLKPKADAPVTITRRKPHLAAFKATGDPVPLKAISRSALQEHQDRHPSHAAYVNPLVTVSAPAATPAFYNAAKRAQDQWYTLLNRTLGCGNIRRLRRSSDAATVSLALSGTLLADYQFYLPGCWPTHAPKPGHLKKTPFQTPTVPLDFLGLSPPNTKPVMEGGDGRVNPPDSGIDPSE